MLHKYQGCLLGLAIGDALGAPIEFCPPGTFTPITTFRKCTIHNLPPGFWTDDTFAFLMRSHELNRTKRLQPSRPNETLP
jgi:ADP-ribosyl-[dinitrogen reductase] hydrolase